MPSEMFEQLVAGATIARRSQWIVVLDPDDQVLLTKPVNRYAWRLPRFEWLDVPDSRDSVASFLSAVARIQVVFDRKIGYFLDYPIGLYVEILGFRTEARFLTNRINHEWRWWSKAELVGRPRQVHRDSCFWAISAVRHEVDELEVVRPSKILPFR